MTTKEGKIGRDDPVAVAEVEVEFVNAAGERREVTGAWFADMDEPTAWYAPGYYETGVLDFDCGKEPGWDLTVLADQTTNSGPVDSTGGPATTVSADGTG